MKRAVTPYQLRDLDEVARTRANFHTISRSRGIGSATMGERGYCQTAESMCGPITQFGGSLTLRVNSKSREVARTPVNSRELFKGENQWRQRPNTIKHEEWSKSRELARTLTTIFSASAARNMTGGRGSCRATESMGVHTSRFDKSLNLSAKSKSVELARTLVNSRELFDGENQWRKRPNPTKQEGWSKSRELARTLTTIFSASAARNMTGGRGSCRATESMGVHTSRFDKSLNLSAKSKSVELARTLVNSRELFDGENQWRKRPNPTKQEGWSKSRELARTLTSLFFSAVTCPAIRLDCEARQKSVSRFGKRSFEDSRSQAGV